MNGALKWISINKYNSAHSNTSDCIKALRTASYKIIATSPRVSEKSLYDLDLTSPVAIFFGQESNRLYEVVKQQADDFIHIPMHGLSESLNISAAAAIVLYALTTRMRKNPDLNWKLIPEEIADLKAEWILNSIYRPDLIIKRYAETVSGA